jgi:hypothetical protein
MSDGIKACDADMDKIFQLESVTEELFALGVAIQEI